jgi:hypothetical protein
MGRNGANGQEGSKKFFHGGLSVGKGQAGECLNVVGEIEVISKLIYKWCLNECVLLCSGQKIGGKSPVVFLTVAGSASRDKVFGLIRPTAPMIVWFDVVGMSRPCAAVKTTTTNGYHGLKQSLTFWCWHFLLSVGCLNVEVRENNAMRGIIKVNNPMLNPCIECGFFCAIHPVAVPVVPIIEIVNSSLRFTHDFSFG